MMKISKAITASTLVASFSVFNVSCVYSATETAPTRPATKTADTKMAPVGFNKVIPVDNQAILRNPGMGYCLYYYTDFVAGYGARLAPSDLQKDWPGLTTVFMRIPWSLVEPEEGKYDWSIVDTPMQRYAQAGMKAGFRFTASENFGEAQYATPKWVKDAGAKGHYHVNPELPGTETTAWEPDFNDPIFLQKLDNFLAAAAARYDGHPDVAYFDVGSFGIWGEGHTWGSSGLIYPTEVIRKHLALHSKNFKKTLLAANVGFFERPGTKPPWKVGTTDIEFPGTLPIPWRGKTYTLSVALHNEEVNAAFKDIPGRLLPRKGDKYRSIPIGELSIAADGKPSFKARTGTLTQNAKDFAADEMFSAAGLGISYDEENQPNSVRVKVRLFLPKQLQQGLSGPSPLLAVREKDTEEEIVAIKAERTDPELLRFLLDNGVTLRDDSVNGAFIQSYFDSQLAQSFWRKQPVILEHFHYGMMKQWNTWNDGAAMLQAVEDDHASYMSIHGWPDEYLNENRELVRKVNLRIGYRFQLQQASWSDKFAVGGRFNVNWDWRNGGVAPRYEPTYPAITLKDKQGGIVGVFVDENTRLDSMMPGKNGAGPILTGSRSFGLPPHLLVAGEYDVFVSVGDRTGKPIIALPLDGEDGARRYKIGTTQLMGP